MVTFDSDNIILYFSLRSVSFVLFRGIYYITLQYDSLSEKLVAALIVTGECRAKTITDNNNKTIEYINFPSSYSPRHIPLLISYSPEHV